MLKDHENRFEIDHQGAVMSMIFWFTFWLIAIIYFALKFRHNERRYLAMLHRRRESQEELLGSEPDHGGNQENQSGHLHKD